MYRSIVEILPFAVAITLASGCATSHCSDPANQSEPDCQPKNNIDMGNMPAFTVTPLRIPIDKTTMISVSAGSRWANKAVSIQQSAGVTYTLGMLDKDGNLNVSVSAMMLKNNNIKLGLANFAIADNPKTVTRRFYLNAKFDPAPSSLPARDVKLDCSNTGCSAYAASLGVFSKNILAVNYFVDMNSKKYLDLRSYKLEGVNVGLPTTLVQKRLRFDDQPSGIAITDMSYYVIDKESPSQLWSGTNPMTSSQSQDIALQGITSLSSFSSNVRDITKVYTGIFSGTVGAYGDATLSGVNAFQVATNDPNKGKIASLVIAGELNGDASPELVIWYGGAVSVYTGSSISTLQFSSSYSSALQTALGVTTPTAVAGGDVDGDELDDVVFAAKDTVSIIINQGDGTFKIAQTIMIPNAGAGVTALAVGDVNPSGQGVSDIVIASQSQNNIAVIENKAQY